MKFRINFLQHPARKQFGGEEKCAGQELGNVQDNAQTRTFVVAIKFSETKHKQIQAHAGLIMASLHQQPAKNSSCGEKQLMNCLVLSS